LGQSFLRLFRSTTIDHENRVLIIDGSESQPPVQTAVQPEMLRVEMLNRQRGY
jgi:hypothetical protein